MHDGYMSTSSEFFEEDEPVADVRAAFERGEKGKTKRPAAGLTEQLWGDIDVQTLAASRARTIYLTVPYTSLLTPQSTASTETVA